MNACVILNPVSYRRWRSSKRTSPEIAHQCALKPTTFAGAARSLAAEAVKEGLDAIVAAGGDGTVNEVLNGIADAQDGMSRARLGVCLPGNSKCFREGAGHPGGFERVAGDLSRQGNANRRAAGDLHRGWRPHTPLLCPNGGRGAGLPGD